MIGSTKAVPPHPIQKYCFEKGGENMKVGTKIFVDGEEHIVKNSRPFVYVVLKNFRCNQNGCIDFDERFTTAEIDSALECSGVWLGCA